MKVIGIWGGKASLQVLRMGLFPDELPEHSEEDILSEIQTRGWHKKSLLTS